MNAGDKVKWTHCSRKKGGMLMTTRMGKVVKDCGALVVVRYRGRDISILPDRLRPIDAKSELTELVQGMAEAGESGHA